MSPSDYHDLINSAFVDELVGLAPALSCVVVGEPVDTLLSPGSLPLVVLVVGDSFGGTGPANADAVIGVDDVDQVVATIDASPLAATSLCVLLRSLPFVNVPLGLALESAVYSTLQGGPEFARWRAGHIPTASGDDSAEPVVMAKRIGEALEITLNRPQRHNAVSARLRDELVDALRIAIIDDSIQSVVLRGAGPSFCSGGDLAEFGSRSDPASAHTIRLARSPARLLHSMAQRTTVQLHGMALGGGIEMAAFAQRVTATPDTRIGLPELALGLIPGAGGTVSMTARMGRQRTAALALSCRHIDAVTALSWGLVDEVTTNAIDRT